MPREVYTSSVAPSLNDISWREFLRRPAFEPPPPEVLDAFTSAPILVTGAGGSIGSALSLRLARYALPALLLLESGENNLCELQRAMADDLKAFPRAAAPMAFALASAGDRTVMEALFTVHRPRIVFHAAAYKHVPLLEEQPLAAIANNIFATETITAVASEYRTRVVLLSTDKAVEPASVMGATKRVAEEIVLASGGTVLRLGNVLASSGSVTEVFANQIAHGGPLTITDPAARRYFLTLDEAVNLVLLASMHPNSSSLLAPPLPAMHGIVELARYMSRQLAPGREIPIHFTGLRPGDKLTERLWSDSDATKPVGDGSLVSICISQLSPIQLQSGLAALHSAAEVHDISGALAQLQSLVPDFHPSQTVLALARHSGSRACV
ncbi:MAG: polysaccharide biosynthesis protein [Terracidiphilus sp.]